MLLRRRATPAVDAPFFYMLLLVACFWVLSPEPEVQANLLASRVILRQTLPATPQETTLRLSLPLQTRQQEGQQVSETSPWLGVKAGPWQQVKPLDLQALKQDAVELTLLQASPASLPATLSAYSMAQLWQVGPAAFYGETISPNDLAYSQWVQPNEATIRAQAKALVTPEMNPLQAMAALKHWLQVNVKLLPAQEETPFWGQAVQTPVETLKSKQGNRLEQALLFASMARAVALPSRLVVGFAYKAPQQLHGLASLVPQVWNEVALAPSAKNSFSTKAQKAFWLPLEVASASLWLNATHLQLASLNGAQTNLQEQIAAVFAPFMGKLQADVLYAKGSDTTRLFEAAHQLSAGIVEETSPSATSKLVASSALPSVLRVVLRVDLTSKAATASTQAATSLIDLNPHPAEWNNPDSVAGQLRLGLEALCMGDAQRAHRYWQQAAELSSTPYQQYRTAVILLGFKAYDLADVLLAQAGSNSLDLADLSQTLRQELIGQTPVKTEQMLAFFQVQAKANRALAEDASLLESLEAAKALKKAYPDWLAAYLLEGDLLQQAGQTKQALAAYEAMATRFGQRPEPRFYKAQCLKETKQWAQAEQAYLQAAEQGKHFKAPMLQSLTHTALTEAKLLKQIISLNKAPKKAEAWAALAEALENADRPEEALDALQQGLLANPQHPLLLAATLRLLAEAGRLNEAASVYKQLPKPSALPAVQVACLRYTSLLRLQSEAKQLALSLKSKAAQNPMLALAVGQWAAQTQQISVLQEVLASALPSLRYTLAGDASNATAFSVAYSLAELALQQGNATKPELISLVKGYDALLLQAQPTHTGALRLKAKIALKEKDLNAAEQALQLALGLEPKQAEALLLMAELELARNHWPEAYNWTALALELDPAYPEATTLAANFSKQHHAPALSNKALWRLNGDEEALLRQYLLQNKQWQAESTWLATAVTQQWLGAPPKTRLLLEESRLQLLEGLSGYSQRLEALYGKANALLSHPSKRLLPLFVLQTVRMRSQLVLLQQLQEAVTLWQTNDSYLYYVGELAKSLQSLEGLEQQAQQQLERLPLSPAVWQSLSLQTQTENPTQGEVSPALAYTQMKAQCDSLLKAKEADKKKQERRFVNN
jgi:tetratricopeptide (TPR) repeat protein